MINLLLLLLTIILIFLHCFSTKKENIVVTHKNLNSFPHHGCSGGPQKPSGLNCDSKLKPSWEIIPYSEAKRIIETKTNYFDNELQCRTSCEANQYCAAFSFENSLFSRKTSGLMTCSFMSENATNIESTRDIFIRTCCDKVPSKSSALQYSEDRSLISKHNCQASETRVECVDGYGAWIIIPDDKIQNIRITNEYFNVTMQQCVSICNKEHACEGFQYDKGKASCVTKYLINELTFDVNPQPYDIVTFQWHCCEYSLSTTLSDLAICLRREKNGLTNDDKCSLEFSAVWVTEMYVICQNDSQPTIFKQINELTKCQDACLRSSCGYYTFSSGVGCLLYDNHDSCYPSNSLIGIEGGWSACCMELEYNLQKPTLESIFVDCIFDQRNVIGYNGTINSTVTNKPCLHWNLSNPALLPEHFPHDNNQHNYCRNLNHDAKGPWCIVSRNNQIEYCDVPKCDDILIVANRKFFHKYDECEIIDKSQCIAENGSFVYIKNHISRTECIDEIIESKNIEEEKLCYRACHHHMSCLYATYNLIDSNCTLAKKIKACQRTSWEFIKLSEIRYVKILCCKPELTIEINQLICPIPLWFYVLIISSYILLLLVLIIIPGCLAFYYKMKNLKNDNKKGILSPTVSEATNDSLIEKQEMENKPRRMSQRFKSLFKSGIERENWDEDILKAVKADIRQEKENKNKKVEEKDKKDQNNVKDSKDVVENEADKVLLSSSPEETNSPEDANSPEESKSPEEDLFLVLL